ncbi:oxidoreductase [Litchfieldia salsa]|uniref:NADPH2 dehydrogenase n=1 Tax=Litchfieldia salsa TaxID=930152 RepID=A0A1H0T4Y7_9BACI|nr:NADH:flavin oxidoreductase [Litchfieldia salsa]SDP49039.1 NADPH2 dehydrogenase [Litchfieldia salsa]
MSKLFSSVNIGTVTLKNRIAMAPMQQRQGTKEAYATDYHAKYYSERAKGEVGLIIIESTSIAESGRLFQDDIGIFSDNHIAPLRKIVDAIHEHNTPVFIQLCHGGRKSSPENNGPFMAPSSLAFDDYYGVPAEMSQQDIQEVIEQFVEAAKRSVEAGFDGIELHAAHGYLIHQFLSPLSNQRNDEYGETFENRLRFLKEVLIAVRKEVGNDFPIQIRYSASDYHEQGLTADTVGEIVKTLDPYGVDAVHISSGGLLPVRPPEVYPGYQVEYADIVKKFTDAPIMAVGLIHSIELAEEIIESNKADCVAIGRPLLDDPYFVRRWKGN